MKKIKNFTLILSFIITGVYGQSNELTDAQYQNIKFNNVLKSSLETSNADESILAAYFGSPTETATGDPNDDWVAYTFNDITIGFENIDSSIDEPSIYYINAQSITINGFTANIGDTIDILGFGILNHINLAGEKIATFTRLTDDCCSIRVLLDDTDNIIKIEYYVWT
jgi:hypothetical protein